MARAKIVFMEAVCLDGLRVAIRVGARFVETLFIMGRVLMKLRWFGGVDGGRGGKMRVN